MYTQMSNMTSSLIVSFLKLTSCLKYLNNQKLVDLNCKTTNQGLVDFCILEIKISEMKISDI